MQKNKTERAKKATAVVQDTWRKAEDIADSFSQFTHGYRVLFLIQRHGDGGETNNTKLKKIITRDHDSYISALYDLLIAKDETDAPLRIYASVNERDMKKAIRNFKYEQLDADYFDEDTHHQFYLDIRNRFIGCLMQPRASKESQFLFDCDSIPEWEAVHKALFEAGLNDMIVTQYATKNGWHVITKPFNPALVGDAQAKLKKDALLLLSY